MSWGQYARDGLGGPNRPYLPEKQKGKREKHVFSGDMVAHVWAQQTVDWGKRSDGRVYFRRDTIYSYGDHFPIARFVEHKGKRAVIFNARKYSVSTSKHQGMVRSALRGLNIPVIKVEVENLDFGRPEWRAVKEHYTKVCEQNIIKAARARRNPECAMEAAKEAVRTANQFAEFFGLKDRLKEPKFTAEFLRDAKERANKHAAAEAAKTRKLNAEREAAIQKAIGLYRQGADCRNWVQNRLTDEDRAQHFLNAPAFLANAATLWRSNELSTYDLPEEFRHQSTLLRLSHDGQQIETSRGASFPTEHGKHAFRLIQACREKGQEYQRNGHSIHLGHFTIDRIEISGDVKARCHTVKWEEIERMAKELKLI